MQFHEISTTIAFQKLSADKVILPPGSYRLVLVQYEIQISSLKSAGHIL